MNNVFARKNFLIKDIKLKLIYDNMDSSYVWKPLESKKIKAAYAKDLLFEAPKFTRPLLVASFVASVDGKINFNDIRNGTLIAKNNSLDQGGALADFWIMNMLRSVADAVIIGSGTLRDEQNITGHIFDKDLESARVTMGKNPLPLNIIVSIKGRTIPYDHKIFKHDIPLMILTSKDGLEYVRYYIEKEYYEISAYGSLEEIMADSDNIKTLYENNKDKVCIVSTGVGSTIDNVMFMQILKIIGVNIASVEASNYTHSLIKDKMLDEIFLNYSGIYVGGNAMSIAQASESFSSVAPPHLSILSLHLHSSYFMYTRQKFIYNT